jgi:hypothetical protein
MNEIIGQILGIIATAITVISYQANNKGKLIMIQSAATLSTCLGYLFLGAWSGFALNIVCLVRNGFFYFLKKGTPLYRALSVVLVAMMVGVGMLSWQGPISLLIIVALMINTVFLSFGKPQLLRYSVLFTCSMILAYNIVIFSIGGIMNEGLAIVSSAIGIVRFRMAARREAQNENV